MLLAFAHTAHAIRAETLLLEAGLPVGVMSLPSSIKAGCGLCLRLQAGQWDTARKCLSGAGLLPEGRYYRITENGKSRYTPAAESENEVD
jgi:hypothetical protein